MQILRFIIIIRIMIKWLNNLNLIKLINIINNLNKYNFMNISSMVYLNEFLLNFILIIAYPEHW